MGVFMFKSKVDLEPLCGTLMGESSIPKALSLPLGKSTMPVPQVQTWKFYFRKKVGAAVRKVVTHNSVLSSWHLKRTRDLVGSQRSRRRRVRYRR